VFAFAFFLFFFLVFSLSFFSVSRSFFSRLSFFHLLAPMYDEAELQRWSHLDDIHANVWAALVRGANDRKDEFHTPTVATIRNAAPELRTVVLRKALAETGELWFHTDARAGKIADLRANPSLAWHFYHPKKQYQLRVRTRAVLHSVPADGTGTSVASDNTSIAAIQWEHTQLLSRRCYCGDDAPGMPASQMTSGLPDALLERQPTPDESEAGRKHFVVVQCVVEEIEWLLLHYAGHRRALFRYNARTEAPSAVLASATWLVP
jgi:pyridoxamine 5'-phosphate oxidase